MYLLLTVAIWGNPKLKETVVKTLLCKTILAQSIFWSNAYAYFLSTTHYRKTNVIFIVMLINLDSCKDHFIESEEQNQDRI